MSSHTKYGRQTLIDKVIFELLTSSNKMKVTDGKQIRDILMKLKQYERFMISIAFTAGYEKLWWSSDMQQNYYENEYGIVEETKEIGHAARERERKQERKGKTDVDDTTINVGLVQQVRPRDEIKPDHSKGLDRATGKIGEKREGTTFNNARLRSILLEE